MAPTWTSALILPLSSQVRRCDWEREGARERALERGREMSSFRGFCFPFIYTRTRARGVTPLSRAPVHIRARVFVRESSARNDGERDREEPRFFLSFSEKKERKKDETKKSASVRACVRFDRVYMMNMRACGERDASAEEEEPFFCVFLTFFSSLKIENCGRKSTSLSLSFRTHHTLNT